MDEKRTFQNGAEIVGTLQQELPVIDVEQSFISSLSRAAGAVVTQLLPYATTHTSSHGPPVHMCGQYEKRWLMIKPD